MLAICVCLALASEDPVFVVRPERVEAADPAHFAMAQARVAPFRPLDSGSGPGVDWSEHARTTTLALLGGEHVVVADSAGGGALPDTLWVDADGDGTVADGEVSPLEWTALGADSMASVWLLDLGVPAELTLFSTRIGLQASLRTAYHLAAEIEIDGAPVRGLWVDMDVDGRVTPEVDRWIALPAEHLARVDLANGMFFARGTDEPWYFGDRVLRTAAVTGDGAVRLALGAADEPRSAYLARRAERTSAQFFQWFEAEREDFFAQFSIDPDRPKAERPLEWFFARDLGEALDRAREQGRPLFVEFSTEACPWCRRLAWLNYRDAEVARRLAGFTLVKIDVDLDPGRSAERLGLVGVPKGVFFDGEGRPVHVVSGWSPPADHVRELDAALEALADAGLESSAR